MKITIETIPHEQQRYPTVGDWQYDESGNLTIRVSQLSDWRREALIAVHELVEVILCKGVGLSQEAVDAFDIAFEKKRAPDDDSEPGDNPNAPYRRQHCFATAVERMLCAELGVSWEEYEEELSSLP